MSLEYEPAAQVLVTDAAGGVLHDQDGPQRHPDHGIADLADGIADGIADMAVNQVLVTDAAGGVLHDQDGRDARHLGLLFQAERPHLYAPGVFGVY